MSAKWDKIIARLLVEAGAPGEEHERLKSDLAEWAESQGYSKVYSSFKSGSRPDVLRATGNDHYLFVGDAKDAENETPEVEETLQRVEAYVKEFASLLGGGGYAGGIIAIATNDEGAAEDWVDELNALARLAGITGSEGQQPSFSVLEYKPSHTWIISW
jgi:hypothetical protein